MENKKTLEEEKLESLLEKLQKDKEKLEKEIEKAKEEIRALIQSMMDNLSAN